MKKTRYQINFQVKAIICVEVRADTLAEAEALARGIVDKKLFANGIEYITGQETVCGNDNMDMWDEVDS